MKNKIALKALLALACLALTACGPSAPKGPEPDAATKLAVRQTMAEVLEISESEVVMDLPIQGEKLGGDALQTTRIIHAAAEACDVELMDRDISKSGSIPLSFSGNSLARVIAKKKAAGSDGGAE